jgi:hypothetical protein
VCGLPILIDFLKETVVLGDAKTIKFQPLGLFNGWLLDLYDDMLC